MRARFLFIVSLLFCVVSFGIDVSQCTFAVISSGPPPETISRYLSENQLALTPFDSSKHNLWDNWGVYDPKYKIYHRYAQSASTAFSLTENDKSAHNQASIRHFVSEDNLHWYHLGLSLEKKEPTELAYWSGKTLIHNGTYYLFHTRGETTGRNQYIALSTSKNGHVFSPSKPVLSPTEVQGYSFSDSDGAIPAWRDPELFWSESLRTWVMLFAAKRTLPHNIVPAIGVAVSTDLQNWELRPALELPLTSWMVSTRGVQLELPNIKKTKNGFELMVSYSIPGEKELGAARFEAEHLFRRWRVSGEDGRVLSGNQFYGANQVYGAEGLYLFSTESNSQPFRMVNVN